MSTVDEGFSRSFGVSGSFEHDSKLMCNFIGLVFLDEIAREVLVASDKKTYDFLIAGVPYKLKTSHDDATVQELVEFVNNKMNQAMSVTKYGSFQNAAVLTALNVAEELILLKRKAHRELEKLEEKAMKLSTQLEKSV